MDKLKKSIEGKGRWGGLSEYINLIEKHKESDPNISLDAAKSLVESIAKTILVDKGIMCDPAWSFQKVVKAALESLPVFQKLSKEDKENAKSVINSFENIARVIGEFRNTHGFFAHGRDLEAEKFDQYMLGLVISSTDLISSFLIDCHSDSLKDRSRIFYEENREFNQYIDDKEEEYPVVDDVTLIPSRSLFGDDLAYKDSLERFTNTKNIIITKLEKSENFVLTRSAAADMSEYQEYLSEEEVKRIVFAAINNPQIYRILGHGHTKNLYEYLLKDKREYLSDRDVEQLEAAFSKKMF